MGLSKKERAVVEAIAVGKPRLLIAFDLGIAPKTVDTFRRKALQKLGLCSNVEIAREALRRGWVSLDRYVDPTGRFAEGSPSMQRAEPEDER